MNFKEHCMSAVAVCAASACLMGADLTLPEPDRSDAGMSLTQAINLRKSGRNFSQKELSLQMVSSLLWAANGINRPDGHRTAPTGLNVQDIDVYVILAAGIYRYDALKNTLVQVQEGDYRTIAGKQDFTHIAPVNLVYVQNLDKAMKADDKNTARHGGIHTGAIMQNVYLFCAANGLISVARDYIDRDALTPALKLTNNQTIILAQTVGFPEE